MSNVVQMRVPTSEPYLTRAQVARHFAVHINTVDNWIKRGCPKHTWDQRMVRMRLSEIESWLNQ